MPRRAVDELNVKQVNRLVQDVAEGQEAPGLHRVGGVGGLALDVRVRSYASGQGLSASWVLRRTFRGRRRDFAPGAFPDVTLAQARERAWAVADDLWRGIDPADRRREADAERRALSEREAAPTFKAATLDFFQRSVRGQINKTDEGKR